MSDDPKIRFSGEELALMQDRQLFPAKEAIIQKIYELFYQFSMLIKEDALTRNFPFPEGTDETTGKISRGENYLSQPYVILDLPRLFSKDDIFAFRSMFWWGHHFSFTLHLAGRSFRKFAPLLLNKVDSLRQKNVFICVKDEMWDHHFEPSNFKRLNDIDAAELPSRFLKVSRKLPVDEWDRVPAYGIETYSLFMNALK